MLKLKHLGIMAALGFMTIGMGAGLAFAGNAIHDNSYSEVEAAKGDKYAKVTSIDNLAVGDTIVIVSEGSNKAMSTTQNSKNRGQVTISFSNNEISWVDGLQEITLESGTKTGTFAFNVGAGYLYAASSGSNYLKTQKSIDDNASWKIDITSSSCDIVAQGKYTRNKLRYNSGSKIFSCYGSGQSPVAIYEKVPTGPVKDEVTGITCNLPAEMFTNDAPLVVTANVSTTGNASKEYKIEADVSTAGGATFTYDELKKEYIFNPAGDGGTATFTITSVGNGADNVPLSITKIVNITKTEITGVSITGVPTNKIEAGDKISTLKAEVTGNGNFDKTVTWSVNDSNLATIDADTGVITTKQNGLLKVTATSNGDASFSKTIEINIEKHYERKYVEYALNSSTEKGLDINFDNIYQFNNNQVRLGKNGSGVTTAHSIVDSVEKVEVKVSWYQGAKVNSFTLLRSDTSDFTNAENLGEFSKAKANKYSYINIDNPKRNSFYKVVINMNGNELISISDIKFTCLDIPAVSLTAKLAKETNNFYAGYSIDINDYVVTATFDDGYVAEVKDATITNNPSIYVAPQTVVNFAYQTVTCSLTVDNIQTRTVKNIRLDLANAKKDYFENDQWDYSNIKAFLVFDDGEEEITDSSYLKLTYTDKDGLEITNPTVDLKTVYIKAEFNKPGFEKVEIVPLENLNITALIATLTWSNPVTNYEIGEAFYYSGNDFTVELNNGTFVDLKYDEPRLTAYLKGADGTETQIQSGYSFKIDDTNKSLYFKFADELYEDVTEEYIIHVAPLITIKSSDFTKDKTQPSNGFSVSYSVDNQEIFKLIGTALEGNSAKPKYYSSDIRMYAYSQLQVIASDGYELVSIHFNAKTWTDDGFSEMTSSNETYAFNNKASAIFTVNGSSRVDFSSIKVEYKKVATTAERLDAFVNDFLMMKNNAFDTEEDTGACRNQGLYQNAKDKLLAMEDYRNGTIEEFKTNSKYAAAKARYEAWARANNDFANCYSKVSKSPIMNVISDTTAIVVVVAVAALSVSAIAFFVLSKKKRNLVK